MAAYTNVLNRLVTCPYDAAHKVKESRLQIHIAKCRSNHLDNPKEVCPFNASHLVDRSELNFHISNCPDKAPLDRKISQSLDKNNPFKGRTAVPSYSASQVVFSDEEYWDEDVSASGSGYVPKQAPADAIVEPRPLAKPSERRALYKQLHRMHSEQQNAKSVPSANPSMPRQPKELSEIQKRQIAAKQENIQTVENLVLERAKPHRIAANIFDTTNSSNVDNLGVRSVVNNFSNLGLGRGSGIGFMPQLDDDEFPALGCGRGTFRSPPKQGPRIPNSKPLN